MRFWPLRKKAAPEPAPMSEEAIALEAVKKVLAELMHDADARCDRILERLHEHERERQGP